MVQVGAEDAIRVLDARFAGRLGELGVEAVFILAFGRSKGLGQVHGIVKNGRGGQISEIVASRVRHSACRLMRMPNLHVQRTKGVGSSLWGGHPEGLWAIVRLALGCNCGWRAGEAEDRGAVGKKYCMLPYACDDSDIDPRGMLGR